MLLAYFSVLVIVLSLVCGYDPPSVKIEGFII